MGSMGDVKQNEKQLEHPARKKTVGKAFDFYVMSGGGHSCGRDCGRGCMVGAGM